MSLRTRRRACNVSRFDSVINFSANGRSSLAFISVVRMRSWRNSSVDMLRSKAVRCIDVRPSFRPATLCFIVDLSVLQALAAGLELAGFDVHAERKAHFSQDVLDFVQGLPAEILRLQHLGL